MIQAPVLLQQASAAAPSAGMTLFDAVCHAMSTVATAGFSTHDASFGFWNDATIELIAIPE